MMINCQICGKEVENNRAHNRKYCPECAYKTKLEKSRVRNKANYKGTVCRICGDRIMSPIVNGVRKRSLYHDECLKDKAYDIYAAGRRPEHELYIICAKRGIDIKSIKKQAKEDLKYYLECKKAVEEKNKPEEIKKPWIRQKTEDLS